MILWRSFRISVIRDSRTLPESARASASRRDAAGTVGLHRTWTGSFWDFQPLAEPVIAHRPCKVLGLGPLHDGKTHHCSHRFATPSAVDSRYANFSPVTDAIGRIRRCQRSTCVDAVLTAPRRGKRNYARDFSPRTVGMIANRRFCVSCRRPSKKSNWHGKELKLLTRHIRQH